MATKNLSISIPVELADFLMQNQDLSPSKIFQSKLLDIIDTKKQSQEELNKIRRVNTFLQTRIQELNEEIEKLKGGKNGF